MMLFHRTPIRKERIYAYDDPKRWGRMLVQEVKHLGFSAKLFSVAGDVPDSPGAVCFLRMLNVPEYRDLTKRLSEELARKKNIAMIPSARECELYDDKIGQAGAFKRWMPPTWYLTSIDDAKKVLAGMYYPFVSKTSEGSASNNVRLITDEKAALKEIDDAFSGGGIAKRDGARQRGYLLWQKFLQGNENDLRMTFIAKKYAYVLIRKNRDALPFASGGGRIVPVDRLDDDIERLLSFCREFVNANGLILSAMDVVRGEKGEFKVLESSCAWDWSGTNSVFFEYNDGNWRPTAFTSKDLFAVMARAISEGEFYGN
jgi:hypothetical protein